MTNRVTEKRCTKCHETKPLERDFPFNPQMKDRHGSWCLACASRAQVEEHRKAAAKMAETNATRDEVRLWAAGLGFPMRPSMTGYRASTLIDRYNREHPDRQYVRKADR